MLGYSVLREKVVFQDTLHAEVKKICAVTGDKTRVVMQNLKFGNVFLIA